MRDEVYRLLQLCRDRPLGLVLTKWDKLGPIGRSSETSCET